MFLLLRDSWPIWILGKRWTGSSLWANVSVRAPQGVHVTSPLTPQIPCSLKPPEQTDRIYVLCFLSANPLIHPASIQCSLESNAREFRPRHTLLVSLWATKIQGQHDCRLCIPILNGKFQQRKNCNYICTNNWKTVGIILKITSSYSSKHKKNRIKQDFTGGPK